MKQCMRNTWQRFFNWAPTLGSSLAALIASFFVMGCTAPAPKVTDPANYFAPRRLAIFFDGTANDESSNTNIHKLHELVLKSNEERKDIGTFYIDGVGADLKVIGMGTGWGIGYRVRLAYKFLAETYRKGDEIYLFGFSRGAYSARILASMLYHVGLPETPPSIKLSEGDVLAIYDAFKGDMTREERKVESKSVARKIVGAPKFRPVDITFLGLWDTVEALGVPDYEEKVALPNRRYGDQLCNVRRAAHALSLDDNRARIFTPILLTRPYLLEHCTVGDENAPWGLTPEGVKSRLDHVVDEVWFTGAHADVGGGYGKGDTELSAISLNWMIAKLIEEGLLPSGTDRYEQDQDGDVHDPEAGLWGVIYRQKWRNFVEYARNSPYNNGKLKIHSSVINRLKIPEKMANCSQNSSGNSDDNSCRPRSSQWRLPELFPYCFSINRTGGYDFTQDASGCFLDEVPRATTKASKGNRG